MKIEPNYEGPVIYVKDASRSVGVAQALVEPRTRDELVEKTREATTRGVESNTPARNGLHRSYRWTRRAGVRTRSIGVGTTDPPATAFTGTRVFDEIDLRVLTDYIDWMPFFNAWEFHGKFPAILDDEHVGEAASTLHNDALHMLERVMDESWLAARAVIGFYPANTVDHDDVLLFGGDDRDKDIARLCHLRQQRSKPEGQAQNCLADYIAPRESGIEDFIGGFAVTAGLGIDEHVARFEKDHDDYSAILLKALADRLAEALAEYLHECVRTEHWAYAPEEALRNEDLIAERYRGIRPAPGYPACPDHTEKGKLWELLDVEASIGLSLTDSYAMFPTAAVSGFYFSHPDSRYFSVGKIDRDQVESYAARKGMSVADAEKWLAPNLGYDPKAADAA